MKNKPHTISPITTTIKSSVMSLPTPSNISYMWNMGSLLGLTLMIQIVSGTMISMHYTPESNLAFESVYHINRNVNYGWMMRLIHANSASLFFIFTYTHISRGILFNSFKMEKSWLTGMIMLFILMGTAFLGYVLPWGQMSFWGATVITNLMSAIPIMGESIVNWFWGGFSINNATLNRFFSLHFLMPFILAAMVIIHIMSLHEKGSTNPMGMKPNLEKILFHPLFSWKDLMAPTFLLFQLIMMMMIFPLVLSDPENFNPANPMSTPLHIQPEWYFLFAYAILRSIPNKLGGVVALVLSILILKVLSLKKKISNSCKFNPQKKVTFWSFFIYFVILTWAGAKQIEHPFNTISLMASMLYFLNLLMIYFFMLILKMSNSEI